MALNAQAKALQEAASGNPNAFVVKELLALFDDSENLERTMKLIADDCVWVMEPGGSEYHGYDEIRAFVEVAMSGRTHDEGHKMQVLNWFADAGYENFCVEYTHGAKLTGKMTAGIRASLKTGVSRYCITYHMRDGAIDRVHEYINATSSWINLAMPSMLGHLHSRAEKAAKDRKRSKKP